MGLPDKNFYKKIHFDKSFRLYGVEIKFKVHFFNSFRLKNDSAENQWKLMVTPI
jgi:hypothetical protein